MISSKPNLYLGIIKWGVFLILIVTPLLFINSLLYPVVFPQIVFFRIVVEILLFFFLLLILSSKEYRPRFSPIILGVSLFLFILIITSLLGVNFSRSFWGTIGREEGLNTLLHIFVFYLILVSVFKKRSSWLKFFKISLFTSLAVSIIAIIFTILFNLRIVNNLQNLLQGLLGNTAFLGFYLLLNIFLALIVFFEERNNKYRLFYIIFLIIYFVALLISGARTAIVAVLFGFFFFFLFYIVSISKISKKRKILTIIAIIAVILLFLISFLAFKNKIKDNPWVKRTPFADKIINTSLQSRTLINRLIVWKVAYKGWQERKFLGWGSENFGIVYQKYFNPLLLSYEEANFDRPHNKFFEILVLNGIIGILSYAFLFLAIFYSVWKLVRKRTINPLVGGALFSFLIVYLFQNFFLFDTLHSYILFFLVIAFIDFLNNEKSESKNSSLKNNLSRKKRNQFFCFIKVPIFFLVLIIISLLFCKNYLSIMDHYYGEIAVETQESFKDRVPPIPYSEIPENSYLGIINFYKKAISYNNYTDIKDLRIKLADFVTKISVGKLTEKKLENLKYVSKEIQKNIEKKPDFYNYNTYLYLGEIYYQLSSKDKNYLKESERFSKEAEKINPYKPEAYIQLFKNAYIRGDFQKTSFFYEKAISLNKDLPQPYWSFGVFYLSVNEKDKALVEFEKAMDLERKLVKSREDERYVPLIPNLTLLFNLYSEKKDYQKLISLYEETINFYQKNISRDSDIISKYDYITLYTSLAVTYAKTGQKEKAKETALKVLKLDRKILEVVPNIQEQTQDFVKNL